MHPARHLTAATVGLCTLCRAGYNFAPYFYSWGYPISTAFSTTLGSLKQWTANPYYTSAIIDSPPPPVRRRHWQPRCHALPCVAMSA